MDRIEVRGRRSCKVRPQEDWRHAVSKINKAVSMKIVIEDSKRCNIPVKRERLKTVSQRRGVNETKTFDSTLSNKAVSVELP